MRVLQIINRCMRCGGAEKFMVDLAVAMKSMNNAEIEVLSISTPLNNDFTEILAKNGIKHFILSKSLYSPVNILKLRKFIKKGNYDVVHVHLFPSLYFTSIAIKNLSSKPKLVYTEHSNHNKRRNNSFFRFCDRIIYKSYDSLIGISEKVKYNLEKHLDVSRVKIINNGINISDISNAPFSKIRNALNIPENAVVTTMVSRITHGKDFNTLIEAIEKLPDNFHLIFVGDGDLFENLKSRVNASPANERIHVLGMRRDVYGILKDSDIAVLSTHHEGFSIVMLEAMACRIPFVASAVDGIKDLVEHIAILFEYQKADSLAEILLHLANDNSFYSTTAHNCYNFAKQYDIRNIAQKYLNEYSSLLTADLA